MTRPEKAGMARLAFESFQYSLEDIILALPEDEDTTHLTALQKVVKIWPEK